MCRRLVQEIAFNNHFTFAALPSPTLPCPQQLCFAITYSALRSPTPLCPYLRCCTFTFFALPLPTLLCSYLFYYTLTTTYPLCSHLQSPTLLLFSTPPCSNLALYSALTYPTLLLLTLCNHLLYCDVTYSTLL